MTRKFAAFSHYIHDVHVIVYVSILWLILTILSSWKGAIFHFFKLFGRGLTHIVQSFIITELHFICIKETILHRCLVHVNICPKTQAIQI